MIAKFTFTHRIDPIAYSTHNDSALPPRNQQRARPCATKTLESRPTPPISCAVRPWSSLLCLVPAPLRPLRTRRRPAFTAQLDLFCRRPFCVPLLLCCCW